MMSELVFFLSRLQIFVNFEGDAMMTQSFATTPRDVVLVGRLFYWQSATQRARRTRLFSYRFSLWNSINFFIFAHGIALGTNLVLDICPVRVTSASNGRVRVNCGIPEWKNIFIIKITTLVEKKQSWSHQVYTKKAKYIIYISIKFYKIFDLNFSSVLPFFATRVKRCLHRLRPSRANNNCLALLAGPCLAVSPSIVCVTTKLRSFFFFFFSIFFPDPLLCGFPPTPRSYHSSSSYHFHPSLASLVCIAGPLPLQCHIECIE